MNNFSFYNKLFFFLSRPPTRIISVGDENAVINHFGQKIREKRLNSQFWPYIRPSTLDTLPSKILYLGEKTLK